MSPALWHIVQFDILLSTNLEWPHELCDYQSDACFAVLFEFIQKWRCYYY
jgi:hypothetical protein